MHIPDIHIKGDQSKPTLYILHGFSSNPQEAYIWAKVFESENYEMYLRRARGHEGKRGKMYHWIQTIREHRTFIDTRIKRPVIVIGHSMGGTMAIPLAKSRYVKKVFAISAINNSDLFENPDLKKQFIVWKMGVSEIWAKKFVYPALPANITLTENQTKKLYLIHDRLDHYVPYTQFLANKTQFNIPAQRTLVFNGIRHALTPNRRTMHIFILKNIK